MCQSAGCTRYQASLWAYDSVLVRTQDGRAVRLLAVIDTLASLMARRGVPNHIRSDNRPGFTAMEVRKWLSRAGAKTLYIEPESPWENGYVESFNGKCRDESLDREISYTSKEVQVLTEQCRKTYNHVRPHSSLGYRPPASQTVMIAEPV